ncbi:MAG: alpha-L-fucosidase [Microthrixaceae bacterium]
MDRPNRALTDQLRRHRVPAWWSDAKLGIFIHWTPASVAGWAPRDHEVGELFASGRSDALAEMPYTEWYQNSLRFPDSSVSKHHREVYGAAPYDDFVGQFEAGLAQWDPVDWARRFRTAGARYVVLVSKHHDGYCLWPSAVPNPRKPGWFSQRDIVGELAEAVRAEGLRFGLYYSGGLDWTFDDRPLGSVADGVAAMPRGDYPDYAEAQVRELIERYRPSVLWNDITWPTDKKRLFALFADYYKTVPDGVVNDRWMPWSPVLGAAQLSPVRRLINAATTRASRSAGGMVPPKPPHFDVRTPEYVTFDDIQRFSWETVRGIDRSFGYNSNSEPSDLLQRAELTDLVAEVVSKGGNLLLNVGPRGVDATIPDNQLERLDWLGEWTRGDGESIFESRPWIRPNATSPEGVEVSFWARGGHLWVSFRPGDRLSNGSITIPGVRAGTQTVVCDAQGKTLEWSPVAGGTRAGGAGAGGIKVDLGAGATELSNGPTVLRLGHVDAC